MVSKRVAARKKLPQHLAILFDTPAKRKRADRIMKEGRLIAELQGKRPKKRKKKVLGVSEADRKRARFRITKGFEKKKFSLFGGR